MRFTIRILALLMTMTIAACSGTGDSEATLQAQNQVMSTYIAEVRSSATYESDRLMVTLEYAQTQVEFARNQNQSLQATLIARGFSRDEIDSLNPIAATFSPPTNTPALGEAPAPAATLPGIGGQPLPTPTLPPDIPSLSDIVTSTGVRDDDCASNPTSQFESNADSIYVVATAHHIPAGTTLVSRWGRDGNEMVVLDFTPDYDIDNACIWFFIDQTDTPFTPGNWDVTLQIGGITAASAAFTVVEAMSGG